MMGSVLMLLGALGTADAKSGNMNGDYAVTSVGDVGTNWNSDYASKGYGTIPAWFYCERMTRFHAVPMHIELSVMCFH